ncbi:hypothetical protein CRUP_037152 [Coryphaenoides rupestris]|nr:hypothetical protein CRUP_037152 [Coryphaenoides rupestris]
MFVQNRLRLQKADAVTVYKDYREPPWSIEAYQFSKQYWCVLAARLAFVILFQNLVMFLSLLVAWLIPDVPKPIVEQLKREKTLLVDVFLREEKEKCQLIHSLFSGGPVGAGLGAGLGLGAAASASPPFHLHHRHHHHHHHHQQATGPPPEPGRYSTLPTVSQAHQAARDPGEQSFATRESRECLILRCGRYWFGQKLPNYPPHTDKYNLHL